MVALAARQASKNDVAMLNDAVAAHAEAAATDLDRFLEKDMLFHRCIASISGNPIYEALAQALFDWLGRFHSDVVRLHGAELLTLAEHRRIVARIAVHDEKGAVRAMIAHLTRANKRYAKIAAANSTIHSAAPSRGEIRASTKLGKTANIGRKRR